jgi:hypothetical protein
VILATSLIDDTPFFIRPKENIQYLKKGGGSSSSY